MGKLCETPNCIVINASKYYDEAEYRKAIADTIITLVSNEYACQITSEFEDSIQILFDYEAYKKYGNPIIYWLDDEETEIIDAHRKEEFDKNYELNHPEIDGYLTD